MKTLFYILVLVGILAAYVFVVRATCKETGAPYIVMGGNTVSCH